MVGQDIMHKALPFLSGHLNLTLVNSTNIVLIPKTQNQHTPADFWPIGLCNALYKIISKVIYERLTHILLHLIDETQGVFLKNRGVAPTSLAGLEIIHQIVNTSPTIQHLCNIAIKLDITKAFDRVKWSFILFLLQNFEFPSSFINLIHNCLSTTQIAIRFNQSKTNYFKPSRC